MKTKVVNLRKEDYDVYIGRPSKWGNPFTIGKDGNRDQVVAKFRYWIKHQGIYLLDDLESLRGKKLGCYCAPLQCHGDVYIELLGE